MGEAISLRVPNLPAKARKVVEQIETPRSPDPIMRRPCADREEKRVTRGSDMIRNEDEQEQLDLNDPNQRGLLDRRGLSIATKVAYRHWGQRLRRGTARSPLSEVRRERILAGHSFQQRKREVGHDRGT